MLIISAHINNSKHRAVQERNMIIDYFFILLRCSNIFNCVSFLFLHLIQIFYYHYTPCSVFNLLNEYCKHKQLNNGDYKSTCLCRLTHWSTFCPPGPGSLTPACSSKMSCPPSAPKAWSSTSYMDRQPLAKTRSEISSVFLKSCAAEKILGPGLGNGWVQSFLLFSQVLLRLFTSFLRKFWRHGIRASRIGRGHRVWSDYRMFPFQHSTVVAVQWDQYWDSVRTGLETRF